MRKLVPQDENDEPASVLLERIRAEKQQLIKDDKIKKDKHESVIFKRDNSHYEKLDGIERCIDDEIPFEISDNWAWTRLDNIIILTSGQDLTPEKYNSVMKSIPYITGVSNIKMNLLLLTDGLNIQSHSPIKEIYCSPVKVLSVRRLFTRRKSTYCKTNNVNFVNCLYKFKLYSNFI